MFLTKQDPFSKSTDMAAIIAAKDWNATAVGSIEMWSVSLRSTLGVMLNSRFPMFLFWGGELTCFYNDACHEGFGINGKHSSILGKPGAMLLSETWRIIFPIIEELIANGEASWYQDQKFPIFRNGKMEDTYWTSSYSPVNNESGKFEGVLVTMNEVTEKVEARKKMEDAEERTRLASEIAEIATWDLDLQTHTMIHSKNLAVIFGHQKTVQLTYADIMWQLHPDDLVNIVEKAFELAIHSGIYKYEARLIKHNGELGWIRSHGKIFFDAGDEPLKIVGTLIDITEEKNRREIMRKSELKFRLLADSMPQLIWTADAIGNLNYYNLSIFTYTGMNQLDLDTGGFQRLIHPNEIEQYRSQWNTAQATGANFLFEHRLLRHDGEYRWHLSQALAQKDISGSIQMWVITSTDIQQQKTFTDQLETQVNERTAELESTNINLVKMNIQLQSFVYVSSHDLQEPLRKIQTFISRLLDTEQMNFTANARDYFERINVSSKRMQSLIQDLLAYSRTDLTNQVDKGFVITNLQELAEQVTDDYSEIIMETKAIVDINNLCETKVIPFQFRQLLNNLIGNSLKYRRPHIVPHIIIKGNRIKGQTINDLGANPDLFYCHISISDNGIGFSMEYKDRIFEIFQRLHNKEQYSGTGIGLAIVKKIVENHRGMITVSGTENEGAVFNIYIPEL